MNKFGFIPAHIQKYLFRLATKDLAESETILTATEQMAVWEAMKLHDDIAAGRWVVNELEGYHGNEGGV